MLWRSFLFGFGITSFIVVLVAPSAVQAVSCTVPTSPGCPTIQAALNQAGPGDTVSVDPGVYFEKIAFPSSGSPGQFITLQGAPGHTSVIDGTGVSGDNMVLVESRDWVKLVGFEIRNNTKLRDGSGVRIIGSGSHIEIRDNRIHDMRGKNAMGITVYGTEPVSISALIIDGNELYDLDAAPSEGLALNGNVEQFEVTNNYVHDVNNIGIVFIGGERDIQPDTSRVARDGVCRGNRVERARSVYGGGFAAAIYVDGGRDILIERNFTTESDIGLEIGAENGGIVCSGVVVRDNVIYRNDKAGIGFGGYAARVGRVKNCAFRNNTVFHNDTLGTGFGELWIQYAENNLVENNLFVSERDVLLRSEYGNINNHLDYNLWFTSAAIPVFVWQGTVYAGLPAFQTGSGQELNALAVDPQFVNAATDDFHLRSTSPARDAGDPAYVAGPGETDIDGAPRVSGARVDIGADEITCGNGVVDIGESCDDGNLIDCDGCDSNCTASSTCGNGIVCGAEQCDDGNVQNGDCCSSTCTFELIGSACNDGKLCTNSDACDGAGSCAGVAAPLPAALCRAPSKSRAAFVQLKDHILDTRDGLAWRWNKGQATAITDFGDPTRNTRYSLCLYDQSSDPQPRIEVGMFAGGSCNARPCWKRTRSGFRYSSRLGNAAASGVTRLGLKAGNDARARITLAGKGAFLPIENLGFSLPVTVQLRNDLGSCWTADYSAFLRNDVSEYRARSD